MLADNIGFGDLGCYGSGGDLRGMPTPNLDDLNLEAAGVAYERRGIEVDARLRTTNKKIFAIGDVAGPYQFTHMAGYHAGIVIRNVLFKLPAKVNYTAVPWVTYTDPELAHVGMTEAEAEKAHPGAINIQIGRAHV